MRGDATPTAAAARASGPAPSGAWRAWPIALACAGLTACGTITPTADDGASSPGTSAPSDMQAAWRQRQIDRAREFEDGGQWPQALLLWQGLRLLEPTDPQARAEAARLGRRIDDAARDHEHRGDEALRRNDLDGAEHHYAHLLALQPDHPRARQALRQIEAQRLRRQPGVPSMAAPSPRSTP